MQNKIALFCAALAAFPTFNSCAQFWTPTSAPSNLWNCVSCSADGMKLLAVSEAGPDTLGPIYSSPDGGVTWVSNSVPATNWSSCASSADGTRLVAVANGGAVYTSTNSGTNWTQSTNAPANYWNCVASSADGTRLAAVDTGGAWPMYLSTNSGATWKNANVAFGQNWNPVTMSADGTRLASGSQLGGGQIEFSTNSGANWFTNSSPTSSTWRTFASSADGTALVCAASYLSPPFSVYISTDSGAAWAHTNLPGPNSVACSADGKTVLVGVTPGLGSGGHIYLSTNSGATWTSTDAPTTNSWQSVACSADGNRLFAAVRGGGIWIAQMNPSPQINFTSTNGALALSWLVPSTHFVLQQSSDLFTWVDATNTPVLNLTNLRDEVALPLSGGDSFYRLKTP